jgi:hypothetical protein
MTTRSCPGHLWLVTSENVHVEPPTIRVKCWYCLKRHRWPAKRRYQTVGRWREWESTARKTR